MRTRNARRLPGLALARAGASPSPTEGHATMRETCLKRRPLTFHAAVRDVFDDYRINGRRSLPDVHRHVRLHLAPFFGRRPMTGITTADVRRYVVRRQGERA